jgi:hypothetical protein
MADKYYPSQVVFDTPEQRKSAQEFCQSKYGRAFSTHCRFMILKDMRESKNNETKPND